MATGYCMKCKRKHEMKDPTTSTKNGRTFVMGTCPTTGIKMSSIIAKK